MKKGFGGLLVILLPFVLVACSLNVVNNDTKGNTPEETETKDDELAFGYIAYSLEDPWNKYSAEAFAYAGKRVGVETIIVDAANELSTSISLMDVLISKDMDGIAINPIHPDQGATLLKMANNANIPSVFENIRPSEIVGDYVATVAVQNDMVAEEAIKFISEAWPDSKVLYIAGAKGSRIYDDFQLGIDRAMKTYGDKVKIVEIIHGDDGTEQSMQVTLDFLDSEEDFDVVFASNEPQALGAYSALVEEGIRDHVSILAVGGSPDGFEMIKNGQIEAIMSTPVSIQGLTTFKNLYQMVKNDNPPEVYMPLPVLPVTKDNLADAIKWGTDDKAVEFINGIE